MNKGLLISYNLAVKNHNSKFYDTADIVRFNTAWFTRDELKTALSHIQKPRFIDIHYDRKKPQVSKHDPDSLFQLASELNVEWVGISNVEIPEAVLEVKAKLKNSKTKVCAKIESLKGCQNLDKISAVSDAIMVDVEDLANEIGWTAATQKSKEIYDRLKRENIPYFGLAGVLFEFGNLVKDGVVYTYGVFDLLHPGHINMLEKAAAEGRKLIVGVVGDEAVAKLKGKDRPVQKLSERLRIVQSLKCVDCAVVQEDYDPVPNLEKFNPDVLVKGDDWDHIPGQEWIFAKGKRLVKPKYSEGFSTSATVKKIKTAENNQNNLK